MITGNAIKLFKVLQQQMQHSSHFQYDQTATKSSFLTQHHATKLYIERTTGFTLRSNLVEVVRKLQYLFDKNAATANLYLSSLADCSLRNRTYFGVQLGGNRSNEAKVTLLIRYSRLRPPASEFLYKCHICHQSPIIRNMAYLV